MDGRAPDPPPELDLALQVSYWRMLPEPGGLRDQRAGEMERLQQALQHYRVLLDWKRTPPGEKGKFIQERPDDWALVSWVLDHRAK